MERDDHRLQEGWRKKRSAEEAVRHIPRKGRNPA